MAIPFETKDWKYAISMKTFMKRKKAVSYLKSDHYAEKCVLFNFLLLRETSFPFYSCSIYIPFLRRL